MNTTITYSKTSESGGMMVIESVTVTVGSVNEYVLDDISKLIEALRKEFDK